MIAMEPGSDTRDPSSPAALHHPTTHTRCRTIPKHKSRQARIAKRPAHRHACELGLEGIVSNRLGSPYRSGRSRHWVMCGRGLIEKTFLTLMRHWSGGPPALREPTACRLVQAVECARRWQPGLVTGRANHAENACPSNAFRAAS